MYCIMPPPYDFSIPTTAESQKRTVAALIGSAAARKARDDSLSEEKFVYNLSPGDRMKFEETMAYPGLNNFIKAPGRGGRKSRKSRRSRKTKRLRSRHR